MVGGKFIDFCLVNLFLKEWKVFSSVFRQNTTELCDSQVVNFTTKIVYLFGEN